MYLLDCDNKVHNIDDSDIICIEVSRPNIYYRTKQGKFKAPRTVADFGKIYNSLGFVRIDKKKLVNMRLAEKFENKYIQFGELKYVVAGPNIPKIKRIMNQDDSN